jgi:hypothetical protein
VTVGEILLHAELDEQVKKHENFELAHVIVE